MTSQRKITCDLTGKPMAENDTVYRVTLTKWESKTKFTKAENFDISHEGFQMFLKNGAVPEWAIWEKVDGNWVKTS